ncbi:EscU/YscU/HrcU family type III secretion system export apparatus switch protein [Pseudomonas matsuisoli]|uniref:Flagellar biosynthetic protein FlhB n=1 Tax=Pseudomonas matsuisoli TaxID=1515666 RepID=A0A917UU82_9PSED|nr:EscU/YscU/HrcU family type III secretion system export apparatus switch protein [Pseudomonas matsuisoli]GGJ85904.1 translocation protein in type III secretion system, RhcU [Pseudomonas matsuisoli]
MSDKSEEKSQPASEKKLREARQKGQLAKSQDMVTGMVILICTLCVTWLLSDIEARVRSFVLLVGQIYIEPFDSVWPRLQGEAIGILLASSVPILAATVITVLLTNIATMRGMVFTVEPIKPDPKRIDPVSGFKRMFSMRSFIEFLKTLFKVMALAVAFVIVYRSGLQTLMESSRCGPTCIYSSFTGLLTPLIVTAVLAFLIVGAIDVLMQRWLFEREMRMTKSEQKREHKDSDGDPQIKRERRKLRQEMQHSTSKVGIEQASLVIGRPGGWAVGLRYERGKTPVPVVVCRAAPDQSAGLLERAHALGLPQAQDAELAEGIAQRAVAGSPLPDRYFQRVADILVAARLI